MAKARQGDTVRVHYTGTIDKGTVFDTTEGKEPMQFTIGGGKVIAGFEGAVVGLEPGQSTRTRVPAEEAYGPPREDRVLTVQREQLPGHVDPTIGQRVQMQQEDGRFIHATVTAVSGTTVTIDTNHPLAGQDLTFDIRLVEIVT